MASESYWYGFPEELDAEGIVAATEMSSYRDGGLEGRVELGIRCAAGNGELFQVTKGRANTRDLGC